MPTTTAERTKHPVITAWSAVSPFGVGREAFEQGLLSGHETAHSPDTTRWGVVADGRAHLVPGFDVRETLGRTGTRGLDRATGLTITAVRDLLDYAPDLAADHGLTTALVLGTTTHSAQGYADVTRASFEGRRPQDVPPVAVPNMAMNRATSASAIWHGLRGPNSTIAAGRVSGLMCLAYGRRLLAQRRADRVVVGGTEEYSQARSWIEHHRRLGKHVDRGLGEGSAVLLLERPESVSGGRTVLAELLSISSRIDVDGEPSAALHACLAASLEAAQVSAADVWAAMPSGSRETPRSEESRLLHDTFGAAAVSRPDVAALIGDTSAAASVFEIAALLSTAGSTPADHDRIAVVTAADPDGGVASAVLRIPQPARQAPAQASTTRKEADS
ncbi:beta-ketoacyl synthase N-terminal-like domain-containing protein [Streptomyces sp. NPDC001858]